MSSVLPSTLFSLSLLLTGSSSSLCLVSLSTGVEVGKDQEFAIDTKGAGGQGKLDVTILSPSRKVVPCLVAPVAGKESSTAKFIPREEGLFAVDVTYDGHPVPGSPYTVEASLPPDPTKVSLGVALLLPEMIWSTTWERCGKVSLMYVSSQWLTDVLQFGVPGSLNSWTILSCAFCLQNSGESLLCVG